MTAGRLIPLSVHGVIETFAAFAIMAAPFVFGFGALAGVASVAVGAALLGLALSTHGDRKAIPLATHAAMDYGFGIVMIFAGLAAATVEDPAGAIFLIGVGAAHTAMTAATRFSAPRRARSTRHLP